MQHASYKEWIHRLQYISSDEILFHAAVTPLVKLVCPNPDDVSMARQKLKDLAIKVAG